MHPLWIEIRADPEHVERVAHHRGSHIVPVGVVKAHPAIEGFIAHGEMFLAPIDETRDEDVAFADEAIFKVFLFVQDGELVSGLGIEHEIDLATEDVGHAHALGR